MDSDDRTPFDQHDENSYAHQITNHHHVVHGGEEEQHIPSHSAHHQQHPHHVVHHHHDTTGPSYSEQELMPQIERAVNAVNAFNRAPQDNIPVAGPSSGADGAGGPLDPAVLGDIQNEVVNDQDHHHHHHHTDDGGEHHPDHHGEHDDEDGGPSRKRRKLKPSAPRVSKACIVCRRQKMRCEGAENPPCKRCRNGGHECIFESNKKEYTKELKDPGSWQRQIEHKVDQLSNTLGAILDALERNGIPVVAQQQHQHHQQGLDARSDDMTAPSPDQQVNSDVAAAAAAALEHETAEQQASAYLVDPN